MHFILNKEEYLLISLISLSPYLLFSFFGYFDVVHTGSIPFVRRPAVDVSRGGGGFYRRGDDFDLGRVLAGLVVGSRRDFSLVSPAVDGNGGVTGRVGYVVPVDRLGMGIAPPGRCGRGL